MKSEKIPYLCGGIFFVLIIQARKLRKKARDKADGGSDGLKDTDVMEGLVYVVTGEEPRSDDGSTLRKTTNDFKTCLEYGPTYIPFRDKSTVLSFNSSYEQKNPDLFCRMSGFVKNFLMETKVEWLVKALIEVIQEDKDIPVDTIFQVTDVEALRKDEFEHINQVMLPVFLVSVIHFILNERKDNTLGRATFEAWHSHGKLRSPWIFKSNVGNSIIRRIIVNLGYGTQKTKGEKDSNSNEKIGDDSLIIPFDPIGFSDNPDYSSEDKRLLQEFTGDYDDIMIALIGDNYADTLISMSFPEKVKGLYETKWNTMAEEFADPLLKSSIYGLIGELNKLSKALLSGSGNAVSMRITRKKIRNLYVKLHPEGFSTSAPYDAFIDDWGEGELY